MIIVIIFVMAAALAVVVGLLVTGRQRKLDERIGELSGHMRRSEKPETVKQMARAALPKLGKVIVPENEAERTQLRARLIQAGLYQRQAMHIFLGVKLSLLLLAVIAGAGLTSTGLIPVLHGMIASLMLFIAGMIGPSFWLDHRKSSRQLLMRRALPDAMDVLIICLEGGLSFQSALKRVAEEIRSAHALLGHDLRIVHRG
ncbi:hypothetical protein ACYOEI_35070, partial [Singulisphaera rosea]